MHVRPQPRQRSTATKDKKENWTLRNLLKTSRLSISLSAALLWTAAAGFSLAAFQYSESWTQTLLMFGCCAVSLGLLQQVAWLRRLSTPHAHRSAVRIAMLWRLGVVIGTAWSFAMLAASHQGYVPERLHAGYEQDSSPWFGTQQLAIAGLCVGCLCGLMTAPWLRINRLREDSLRVRSVVFASLAGVPLALYTAYESGAIAGLVDIAIQGVLVGIREPATVSSGAVPSDYARGNALNSLFVARSVWAWVGVALGLVIVSVVARIKFRKRTRVLSCLLALALSLPALFLIHWLANDGYRRIAPHLWQAHDWPSWHTITLVILPWTAVSVMLSIRRERVEVPTQKAQPIFLCDAYLTYLVFAAIPVVWIWEEIRSLADSGLWGLMAAFTDSMFGFTLMIAAGEMISPLGGMLMTALAFMSLGAAVSRWRHAADSPRKLTTVGPAQISLLVVVSYLVALVVICTIPFGIALMHVRF